MVPVVTQDTEDVGAHGGAHGRVERRKGLVQEDDLWPDGEGAGERDPLLLTP